MLQFFFLLLLFFFFSFKIQKTTTTTTITTQTPQPKQQGVSSSRLLWELSVQHHRHWPAELHLVQVPPPSPPAVWWRTRVAPSFTKYDLLPNFKRRRADERSLLLSSPRKHRDGTATTSGTILLSTQLRPEPVSEIRQRTPVEVNYQRIRAVIGLLTINRHDALFRAAATAAAEEGGAAHQSSRHGGEYTTWYGPRSGSLPAELQLSGSSLC